MDQKLQKDLEQFLSSYQTMRKYQKQFFNGNKGAMKNAIFWENQTDNYAKKVQLDNKLVLAEINGDATQGRLI